MKANRPDCTDDPTRMFYEMRSREYADATRLRALSDALAEFSGRLPAHGSVLDVGCGAGHDLAFLRARGLTAVGLDYAAAIARIARAASHTPVVVADMRAIPFAEAAFDGVWASASLLHLPRADLPVALREIKRVVKPGGLLFASVKTGTGDFRDVDGRLFTLFRKDGFESALMQAGFFIVETAFNGRGSDGAQRWMTSLARSR